MAKKPSDNTNNKQIIVLPKEFRYMAVAALENSGDMSADAYDDATILQKYNDYVLKLENKVVSFEVSHETKNINFYLSKASMHGKETKVTDKEFIMRLFKMNVPPFYLFLFKDADKDLKDKEIWRIINKSGINPFNELSALTKMKRSPVRPKVAQGS
jgi:hypothetical protein